MYAIVEIAGQQFKIEKDQKVYVHRLDVKEGEKITFDNVLLLDDAGSVTIGAPAIEGALVEAKVLRHLKGSKVIVFKKKRRKGYKVKNGHRQSLTEIVVETISLSGAKKSKETKEKKLAKSSSDSTVEPKVKKGKVAYDLKKIEGIGPKAAEALIKAKVDTFDKLADKSVEDIKAILTEASSTLAHLDPTTWAQQSRLAAEGKWEELKVLQDKLNGGVEK